MTTTADGTARAAAQLGEAARDVALVAERRAAQYEATGHRAGEATDGTLPPVGEPPDDEPEALVAEAVAITVITAIACAGVTPAADDDSRTAEPV